MNRRAVNPPVLALRKGEDRRLRAGHPWVFANEVDTARTPLSGFTAGAAIAVADHAGAILGTGYVNPHSLICARLVSRDPRRPFGDAVIGERIARALALRERCYADPFYRLVYGESDGLPGLIVDRYGAVLVVQITTAGMEVRRAGVLDALREQLRPEALVLRNDLAVRSLEGLEQYVACAHGEAPGPVEIVENGHRFEVDVMAGQKTGWYYDQRENRAALPGRLVTGRRVLDVYSYTGAWAVHAAALGAAAVTCIESAPPAAAGLRRNAALNGVADRVSVEEADALAVMKRRREAGERFDVVIVDPPAFVKRRRDLQRGVAAYRRLNRAALDLLADGGLLVSASCSAHLDAPGFRDVVRRSGQRPGLWLRIIGQGTQGPDHPVHPAMPETGYLKCLQVALERAR